MTDHGPGIPASERELRRVGREGQLLHISGMDLWFLKWTINHSGGELAFEDNECSGTTARIRIPKALDRLVGSLAK